MDVNVVPQWLEPLSPPKLGRDHLGLGSVSSEQVLMALAPSIYVLTFHPRYYSFYVFLLDEYWRRGGLGTQDAWKRFFRPREFIFSIGAHLCDQPEHGNLPTIVGGQKTQPLARQQISRYAFDPAIDYIKSPFGGYGLYYRAVAIELELVIPGGPGFPTPVDAPTLAGQQLAAAFRKAVEGTEYYRRYFELDTGEIPLGVLQEYIRRACLCQSQRPEAPDRPLLLELLLTKGRAPAARRATFRMLLDLASQTNGYPINQPEFRQLVYFGAAANGATYRPEADVQPIYQQWRLYQAREYYAFALNALWLYLCEWGSAARGDLQPVPLAQLWQHLEATLNTAPLAKALGIASPGLGPNSGLMQLHQWLDGAGRVAPGLDDPAVFRALVTEDRLYRLLREGPRAPAAVMAGLSLLCLVYLRFKAAARLAGPEWEIARMGGERRLSLDWFIRQVEARLAQGPITMREFARWLFERVIIPQHQLVATEKLPDNTFRYRRERDSLRFWLHENYVDFNDSRFLALISHVRELGLCGDLREPDHPLMPDGERLLREGDLA